ATEARPSLVPPVRFARDAREWSPHAVPARGRPPHRRCDDRARAPRHARYEGASDGRRARARCGHGTVSGLAGTSSASDVERQATPGLGGVRTLVRERAWTLTVWGAMLGWTIVLASIARRSYDDFGLARFDLGNMVQAVWSTAHGHPLEMTNGSTGEQMVRLGTHVDPILVLLTPFWALWPSPLSLAFVQIAAVAAGALPVFWLARRHLGSEKLGCVLALAYLAYPWLSWSAVGAIHPVTFAIPLFLYAIWFLDS